MNIPQKDNNIDNLATKFLSCVTARFYSWEYTGCWNVRVWLLGAPFVNDDHKTVLTEKSPVIIILRPLPLYASLPCCCWWWLFVVVEWATCFSRRVGCKGGLHSSSMSDFLLFPVRAEVVVASWLSCQCQRRTYKKYDWNDCAHWLDCVASLWQWSGRLICCKSKWDCSGLEFAPNIPVDCGNLPP